MDSLSDYEVGCDEAGRGPWAGPIVAAAVLVSESDKKYLSELGLRDSKTLTAKKRQSLFVNFYNKIIWSVGVVSAQEIDTLGLQRANVLAYERAMALLNIMPTQEIQCDHVGGFLNYWQLKNKVYLHVKGESKFISIATASVIAKEWRDEYMRELGKKYPDYGFADHAGYGTEKHVQAIKTYGVLDCHRKSFSPIKKIGVSS